MLLCAKHGLPFGAVAEAYRAALDFACPDENGVLFPADAEFRKKYALPCPLVGSSLGGMSPSVKKGETSEIDETGAPAPAGEAGESEAVRAALPSILTEVSGLDRNDPVDSLVYNGVRLQPL
jgi:hypothetical protein